MSVTTTAVAFRGLSIHLNIEHAEDRVHRGRTYAPSDATVNYSDLMAPGGVISGYIREKDGTLSAARVVEHWRYEDAPEWLKAVVDAERPEWAAR